MPCCGKVEILTLYHRHGITGGIGNMRSDRDLIPLKNLDPQASAQIPSAALQPQ
jgi:hypothetical protein